MYNSFIHSSSNNTFSSLDNLMIIRYAVGIVDLSIISFHLLLLFVLTVNMILVSVPYNTVRRETEWT